MDRRSRIFVGLVVVCLVGIVVSIVVATRREGAAATPGGRKAVAGVRVDAGTLLFRTTDRAHPKQYGRMALVRADRPAGRRRLAPPVCDRLSFAGGRGLCLTRRRTFLPSYAALVLGPRLEVRRSIKLGGAPSRARISADGRYGASTVFVSGHSYASAGEFSTQTRIYDLARGRVLLDLEDVAVSRDGRRLRSADFNFWGVTFARDSSRFYATLATKGKTYLVRGDVRARSARVVHENVECPSLSPDGTRIAYKKKVGGPPAIWRFHVLDLRTMRETPLAEGRPIDDQLEWLDDRTVLYGSDESVWTMPADGSGRPRKLVVGADSPAVVR